MGGGGAGRFGTLGAETDKKKRQIMANKKKKRKFNVTYISHTIVGSESGPIIHLETTFIWFFKC